jgi:hypothetical protein
MFETCPESDTQATIHLSDPDFESADSLCAILAIIKDQAENNPEFHQIISIDLDINMVNFVKKYEDSTMNAIKLHLFDLASEFPPDGGRHVLVAATLAEWNLCGRLVIALDGWQGNTWIEESDRMRKVLDWRAWTPEIMRELSQISEKFLWAVCQVGTKHARAVGYGGISYADMGPDLARIMRT